MQGCRRVTLLAGAMLAVLAGGCLSSGREQSSRSGGPSPSFGLNYVPQQSEPPLESTADGQTSTSGTAASRKNAIADLDAPVADPSSNKSIKLANWLATREKQPPQRKPLPLSARAPDAADDERVDPYDDQPEPDVVR